MVEKNDPERIQKRSGLFFYLIFCNRLTKEQIWSFFYCLFNQFPASCFQRFIAIGCAEGGGVSIPQFRLALGPITTSNTPPEAISS